MWPAGPAGGTLSTVRLHAPLSAAAWTRLWRGFGVRGLTRGLTGGPRRLGSLLARGLFGRIPGPWRTKVTR
jgi:hypothetical protein